MHKKLLGLKPSIEELHKTTERRNREAKKDVLERKFPLSCIEILVLDRSLWGSDNFNLSNNILQIALDAGFYDNGVLKIANGDQNNKKIEKVPFSYYNFSEMIRKSFYMDLF